MSGATPRVSVIIPARNEAVGLVPLLGSLAALEFSGEQLEVIVVDHESTDETGRIAREWGARVLNKTGGTISSVRNFGAAAAQGEIFAFLDADCAVESDWLTKAMAHFDDPGVGAVGSHHLIPLDPPTWVRQVLQKEMEARPRLSEGTWLPSGNMLVRRDVFREVNGFDESLVTCEDVDLSYRVGLRHRLVADMEIRCWHFGAPTTLWEVFRKELWRGHDNFVGAVRHGLRLTELPSLVLPIYFVSVLFALGVTATRLWLTGSGHPSWVLLSGGAFLGPLVALAVLMSARSGDLRYVPQFTILYSAYFLARSLAPFRAWRNF